jgi:peptidoglycan/xylan/chitin deacetylase (PgdA/CDA1 family)
MLHHALARFTISLDFELIWGVRDHATVTSYGKNILGAREAVLQTLDLFEANQIRATWATVGFLFFEEKEELMAALPPPNLRPQYPNPGLSNYNYLSEIGRDEKSDPYRFGGSLVRRIASAPGQEIGTHTFSHYYCLEGTPSLDSFAADLDAALAVAKSRKISMQSIVFPRNQFTQDHINLCREKGIGFVRLNPKSIPYRPRAGSQERKIYRALRLIDTHLGILGPHTTKAPKDDPLYSPPASRFLRPRAGNLASVHSWHIATIKREMTKAAATKTDYHLWWHPHNFGADVEGNMAGLRGIVSHYHTLHTEFGMTSNLMNSTRP